MSDLKPNAQEDKDVEPVSDSPGRTQEPLQSHTFSLKNNTAGNSLPSGALVNGPGSHPTSEVDCVLNKGTVLSNNVLDAAWQLEKDTSPEVLPPPSELQSDAWKNTAGPVVKTLATQPGVNTPLSQLEENESKLAYSTLSGDSAEQMHINQPLTKQTIKTRSRRDAEWLSRRLQKQSADREVEKGCEGNDNFSDDASGATGSFLESSENERNPYARRYFRKRQRFSAKDQSSYVPENEDDGDEGGSDIEKLIIKEEYIETTVCDDSPESPCTSTTSDGFDVLPTPGVEHKLCPYCPAMFKSGVGLSNHVRGHLHRVGLSYNARHMVSPEQVALRDRQPRIRRRIPTSTRKLRKAVKPETQGEHTCPLCWGWFDTKTGLSNHVRGHLKRIGKSVTSGSKSPLCILNELLQDNEERDNMLQVLNNSQSSSQPFISQKFISSNGLFLMRTGLPVKIQYEMRSPSPVLNSFVPKQETEAFSEQKKLQLEAQRDTEASSSTLVELLKARHESLELTATNKQEVYANNLHDITKDCMEGNKMTGVEPNWAHGECESNKLCVECNSSFPAAVSLSGRLRAYACRKRIAILEGPGYDYKQKKPRPGLKKKILPALNAEMYTLTCRFCDLVFQGPLSIQEDWIKHLQRHLLHTSVPYSGTGMIHGQYFPLVPVSSLLHSAPLCVPDNGAQLLSAKGSVAAGSNDLRGAKKTNFLIGEDGVYSPPIGASCADARSPEI
ncbi:hypothetical protein PAMA_001819 [Pampus argenteus]